MHTEYIHETLCSVFHATGVSLGRPRHSSGTKDVTELETCPIPDESLPINIGDVKNSSKNIFKVPKMHPVL
jgi:hypothetical protein